MGQGRSQAEPSHCWLQQHLLHQLYTSSMHLRWAQPPSGLLQQSAALELRSHAAAGCVGSACDAKMHGLLFSFGIFESMADAAVGTPYVYLYFRVLGLGFRLNICVTLRICQAYYLLGQELQFFQMH